MLTLVGCRLYMLFFKVFVCSFYGLVSIAQTLNSRFLFKNLQFDFYSSVHLPPLRCSCCSGW
jgi:hypothetical protein